MANRPTYTPLSFLLMVRLAAPHTWAASVCPVLVAVAMAAADGFRISAVMACILLAISVLFQSAVNTANDYFDYLKGTDTVENQDDPTDAVLVYNNVDPKEVRAFAIALVVAAFVLGLVCIVRAGWIPLVIALVGAAVVFLYSGGRTPISYLPIGEIVSGFTMGGLILFASYYCLTGTADASTLIKAIPLIVGIALIMMTNNTCDIDKDVDAGRKTLPVLLGHDRAIVAYRALVYIWMACICILVLVYFRAGWIVLPFMVLAVHPIARALLGNPLTPATRAAAFAQCTALNVSLAAFYAAAIMASTVPVVAW